MLLINDKKSKRTKIAFPFSFMHRQIPFYLPNREKKTNKNEQIRGDDVFLILVPLVLCNKRSYRHNVLRMSVGGESNEIFNFISILFFICVAFLPKGHFMSSKILRSRYVPRKEWRDNVKKIWKEEFD